MFFGCADAIQGKVKGKVQQQQIVLGAARTLSRHSLTINIQNFPFLLLLRKRESGQTTKLDELSAVASPSPTSPSGRTGSSQEGRGSSLWVRPRPRDHVLNVKVCRRFPACCIKNKFHRSSLFQDSRLRSLGEAVSSCQVHFGRHRSNYLLAIYIILYMYNTPQKNKHKNLG